MDDYGKVVLQPERSIDAKVLCKGLKDKARKTCGGGSHSVDEIEWIAASVIAQLLHERGMSRSPNITSSEKGENTVTNKSLPLPVSRKAVLEEVQVNMDTSCLINVAGDLAKFKITELQDQNDLTELVLQSRVFIKLLLDEEIKKFAVEDEES